MTEEPFVLFFEMILWVLLLHSHIFVGCVLTFCNGNIFFAWAHPRLMQRAQIPTSFFSSMMHIVDSFGSIYMAYTHLHRHWFKHLKQLVRPYMMSCKQRFLCEENSVVHDSASSSRIAAWLSGLEYFSPCVYCIPLPCLINCHNACALVDRATNADGNRPSLVIE